MDHSFLERLCTKCGKPGEFSRNGRGGWHRQCKQCVRTASRAHYLRTTTVVRRNDGRSRAPGFSKKYFREKVLAHHAFLATYKDRPCLDCGCEFPSSCMDFDHVRGEKVASIACMKNWSRDRLLVEVAKCDLVCANCHRIRTANRRSANHHSTQPAMLHRLLQFRAWMASLKTKPCTDCGGRFPSEAMDFDHVRGEKVKGVSAMWSWSRFRVEAELFKCDLVCANCHRLRTQSRRNSATMAA